MNDKISEYINKEVIKLKEKTYDLLDYTKLVLFTYLLQGKSYDDFKIKLESTMEVYDKNSKKMLVEARKELDGIVGAINKENTTEVIKIANTKGLQDLKFKLDLTSTAKARKAYVRVIKNFYKTASKTLQKEYINEEAYLSEKVSQYDKVEKVVPYYNKSGSIQSYHDIAGYNSMVYNTNLTSEAWNSTIDSAIETKNDLVYVPAHPYSCPLCQEWQGKIYSLKKNSDYPYIEEAIAGGLKHPNCKHPILQYWGQDETDEYSSEEWTERYDARQKKQSLELKRKRLKNDREIFKKLGNQEEVDKLNKKIKALNSQIKEQKEIMK